MVGTRASKREAMRETILEATIEVLRREGVAACTVRAIAEASGLSKSAMHYYFEEVDQIVDLAFERLMSSFIEKMERAAGAEPDPVDALWAAVHEYLRLGTDHPGGSRVPMLAFEYQIMSTRRGDTTTIDQLTAHVRDMFRTLTAAAGVPDPDDVADVLLWALIGAVVRSSDEPTSSTIGALAAATALPPPRS